jgi:hypothetical protein
MRAFSLRFLVVAALSFVAGYAQLRGWASALFVACWAVVGFTAGAGAAWRETAQRQERLRVKLREYERRAVGASRATH